MSEIQQFAQQWLEVLVYLLPVGYSFGAGMVSTVNPCGFAMLPAYLSLYLGAQESAFYQRSIALRMLKALFVGLVVSAGFVLLFAIIGAGISAGGSFLMPAVPWVALLIGVALAILGLWIIAGRTVYAGFLGRMASRIGDPRSTSVRGFFLFGVAFGAASLSCTLPIFLVVVGSALATGGFFSGLVQFLSYGMGMGLVLILLTLSIALFKEGIIVTGLCGVLPYVERAAAVLLLVAGSYIVYYWLFKGGLIKIFV
ncbi:MAG: cytochrome c biogenesis CcdA family protein [Candidatus Binatia bacterium]